MSRETQEEFVYMFIDNGLLQDIAAGCTEDQKNRCTGWLEPIYKDRALEVSPLLVDIEAAYSAGALDQVMSYLNARTPALHVSIIEASLDLEEMAQHLRRFIFILDSEGKQFTLRYADCAVLVPLSSVLNAAQWKTITEPIVRWRAHDRAGRVINLPSANTDEYVATPLRLDQRQFAALYEASEPDHFIQKVQMMLHGAALPGDPAERYAWALAARQLWQFLNNSSSLFLLFLTEASLLTRGKVLNRPEIKKLLSMNIASEFRHELQKLID
jgi:hypothetical protein